MSELYEKYDIKESVVQKWAEKTYPQFLGNPSLLAQLYLRQVKKVTLDPSSITIMRGKQVLINELKEGEWCIIEGVVATKMRENAYSGCPVCMKKIEGEYCPTDGKVVPTTHRWIEYVVGDNSGDVIVSFPPRIANTMGDITGQILQIRGVLGDQGSFL